MGLLKPFKNLTRREKIARAALLSAFVVCAAVPAYRAVSLGPLAAMGMGGGSSLGASDLPPGVGIAERVPDPQQTPMAKALAFQDYVVEKGETIGAIAQKFNLKQDSILSCNAIKNSRTIQIGQTMRIPNQDGILRKVRKDETVASLADKYEIDPEGIRIANGLKAGEPSAGDSLFLPAARMERVDLAEINGDLFIWPVRGPISSTYGWRTSPFTGARQFHSGLDIAVDMGTPIKAAMAGRVVATGYDVSLGNYVVLRHHSGYQTMYGHMSVIRVSDGQSVALGQRIGDVGSTGLSTGAHCHFSVFKNGETVNPRYLIN